MHASRPPRDRTNLTPHASYDNEHIFEWISNHLQQSSNKTENQLENMSSRAKKEAKVSLFDEDENDKETFGGTQLAVNKNYADRYNNWRGKEEMQKCKSEHF